MPRQINTPHVGLYRHFRLDQGPLPLQLMEDVTPVVVLHTHVEDFPLSKGSFINNDVAVYQLGPLEEGCYQISWTGGFVNGTGDSGTRVMVSVSNPDGPVTINEVARVSAGTAAASTPLQTGGQAMIHIHEGHVVLLTLDGTGGAGNFAWGTVIIQRV